MRLVILSLACFSVEYNGRGAKPICEQNPQRPHLSIFVNHFLSKPSENASLLRVLFVEKQWSAAQISKVTGWPKTSVIDALNLHAITREAKDSVRPRYGWKVEDGQLVPHIRQQLVVEKMKKLRDGEGWSLNRIARFLNEKKITTAHGKRWDHKAVQIVLNAAGRKSELSSA